MEYKGIHNFNDKCRYVLLKLMRSELTRSQAGERIRLRNLYEGNIDLHKVSTFLMQNGMIASLNDNPIDDEEESDIYTTDKGLNALENGMFDSEHKETRFHKLVNIFGIAFDVFKWLIRLFYI